MEKYIKTELQNMLGRFRKSSVDMAASTDHIINLAVRIVAKNLRDEDTIEDVKHLQAQIANVEAIYHIRIGDTLVESATSLGQKIATALAGIAIDAAIGRL